LKDNEWFDAVIISINRDDYTIKTEHGERQTVKERLYKKYN
jgi:hypothetical protein